MTYIAHGTDPNEIGHGVDIDLNDTPGSTGGKFIGFGEPGTSAKANRAHWFLSQNIDHVYQEVHREIAVPKGYDRTSPGGGESTFQFPTGEEIWMGDDSYPGSAGSSDLEGMHMLFDVLDSNYNELTDGADNEIRVKLVRESTNTTDMYQGGSPFVDSFQDQPIIHFIAVDPATGATVTDPYTIPAATNYKVQCGVKSTIAELPADALVRYKVQGASEVEAGTFLQDGTRPMTGNLDLDGNNLINADVVSNVTGEPLDISSDHNLLFKDQYLSAGLALSESGQTALYQPVDVLVYPSLVGAVNSGVEAQEFVQGDRSMDRTGTFTTGSAPAMTHPAITVSLGGQILHFAGDTVTASGGEDGQYYLYVTAAGVLSFGKFANWAAVIAASAGAIPIWTGELTGSETSWDGPVDLRWAGTSGKHDAIYVGTGVGADFASLNDAANFLAVTAYGAEDTNISCEIIVVGEAAVTSTVTLPAGWTLRGLAKHGQSSIASSVIKTATGFTTTTNVIVTGANCMVKDLEINWNHTTTDQDSNNFGLYVVSNCLVEGVKFSGTRQFGNNLKVESAVDNSGPIIRDCYFDDFGVTGGVGLTAKGQGRVHVENCTFVTDVLATCSINFEASGAAVDARGPAHTIQGCSFKGRASYANILVAGPNVLIDSCQAELSGSNEFPFIRIEAATSQNAAGVTIRNCLVEGGYIFVQCEIDNASVKLLALIEGCSIYGFASTIFDFDCDDLNNASLVTVRGCNIQGQTAGNIGHFDNVGSLNFSNNRIMDGVGAGLYVGDPVAIIDGNYINSWETGACIELDGSADSRVSNNVLWYSGTTAGVTGILVNTLLTVVDGNRISGNVDYLDIGIHVKGRDNRIANNDVSNCSLYCVYIEVTYNQQNHWIINNTFSNSCVKEVTVDTVTEVQASAIYISGAYYVKNILISGNLFKTLSGSAIRAVGSYSRDGARVCDNVFDGVEARYLYDGGGDTPKWDKYAVIAVEGSGSWHFSNNCFRNCGFGYPVTTDYIIAHEIYLDVSDVVIISNCNFGDSISSGNGSAFDYWRDIGIYGGGDVICTGCYFYRDVDGGTNYPAYGFSQVYHAAAATTSKLTLCGCQFILTGDMPAVSTSDLYSCVEAETGSSGVFAIGCYSLADYTMSGSKNIWKLSGGVGNVIGCGFSGPHDTDITQATIGGCLGNFQNQRGSANLLAGGFPSATVYNANSTWSPRTDFNREY